MIMQFNFVPVKYLIIIEYLITNEFLVLTLVTNLVRPHLIHFQIKESSRRLPSLPEHHQHFLQFLHLIVFFFFLNDHGKPNF